jgi:hypothetical protein
MLVLVKVVALVAAVVVSRQAVAVVDAFCLEQAVAQQRVLVVVQETLVILLMAFWRAVAVVGVRLVVTVAARQVLFLLAAQEAQQFKEHQEH